MTCPSLCFSRSYCHTQIRSQIVAKGSCHAAQDFQDWTHFRLLFLVQGKVHILQLDLADLSSIQTVASELQKLRKIDYLILNAGIMAAPYSLTKHGFESQFGPSSCSCGLFTNIETAKFQPPCPQSYHWSANVPSSSIAVSMTRLALILWKESVYHFTV